jgi:hypothetical protein
MTSVNDWLVKLSPNMLEASFFQEDGSSRPGTEYMVSLKCGEAEFHTTVRAYLADDLTPAARADRHYQGQTVIGYVFDRLAAGWVPKGEPLPGLTILNPDPGYVHKGAKPPLWKRLFGAAA